MSFIAPLSVISSITRLASAPVCSRSDATLSAKPGSAKSTGDTFTDTSTEMPSRSQPATPLSAVAITQEVSGTPLALGTGQQLAVYRIVQESLTNALRHAEREEVTVHFGWTAHGLDLTVSSALAPAKTTRTGRVAIVGAPTAGHGIAGMTERAALVGGHLTAGVAGARFVVHAWLPERAAVADRAVPA